MLEFNIEQTTSDVFDEIKMWDMLIVGGGPAGMNASIYAKRNGLDVGIITGEIGGQLHNTTDIDNYLGFPTIKGPELADRFLTHVKQLDVPILKDVFVQRVVKEKNHYRINLSDGRSLGTRTLMFAAGGLPRKLNVPGENELAGKGVTYCATCDAPFFKDKHVIVAGGGNSAADGVLDLEPWAKKITVVHRSQWRADQILLDKVHAVDQLTVHLETQILKIHGDNQVTGVEVLDKKTQETRIIPAEGILIEIGTIPNSKPLQGLVDMNPVGEIIVGREQHTSEPGVFAAGDVTENPHKQIVISAAEGAKAALAAKNYLNHSYEGE